MYLFGLIVLQLIIGMPERALAQGSVTLGAQFVDVTEAAGVAVVHGYQDETIDLLREIPGGAAGGDVDGDGWPDLYVIGGDIGSQYLFRNRGDGSFAEVAKDAGVDLPGEHLSGPALADMDGDRDLDLFVGAASLAPPLLFRNDGPAGYVEIGRSTGMFPAAPFIGATFADYDGDGDLDLFTSHWLMFHDFFNADHLWRNEGSGHFVGATEDAGLVVNSEDTEIGKVSWSFTGNFADLDDDGRLDLVLASDFGLSQVFRNLGDGRFADVSTDVLTDENGMGSAVGDYDNDGDVDWFVTSVYDESTSGGGVWGHTGNRLYQNAGDGTFVDATAEAGVADGSWGWGACFADFDNDGDLDLLHVNGYRFRTTDRWLNQPARFFVNQGDGTFVEGAEQAGIADRGNGRGLVCFDYDRDGDIDVFVANIIGPSRLYRNDLAGGSGFLQVRLVGIPPNTEGIGARINIEANGVPQMREVRSGNNYVSQDPAGAHFGLGDAAMVDRLRIRWPSGAIATWDAVPSGREVVIPEAPGDTGCDGVASAADFVAFASLAGTTASAAACPIRDIDLDGQTSLSDLGAVIANVFGE
jgi:hypothetical protein